MINHNGTHLLVKVPEGASNFDFFDDLITGGLYLVYHIGEGTNDFDILKEKIPPGEYDTPFLASEAGEEMAKGVVGIVSHSNSIRYENYEGLTVIPERKFIEGFDTPTASLHSLCRSLGWEPETTLIVPILK